MSEITQLLHAWSSGEAEALDRLVPLVYAELHLLARAYLRREHQADVALAPTVLVHEAYLKLIDQQAVSWQNRAHFFGVAATLMRRILVHDAERRDTQKRGGSAIHVALTDEIAIAGAPRDVRHVDQALTALSKLDERQGRIVELRFFGGLSIEEVAEVLSISPRTVKREWATARLWLRRELSSL